MKKHDSLKTYGVIQREEEIKRYGRIMSLRPGIAHKSKKVYSRKSKHNGKEC